MDLGRVTPRTPGQIRRVIGVLLAAWGHEGLLDDIQFVATELVTNVLRHATGRCIVVLVADRLGARLHVRDYSIGTPAERLATDVDEDGRGLCAVEACSTSLGVQRLTDGKIISAFLAAPGPGPAQGGQQRGVPLEAVGR
ncbi:ATP-binding protein [Streptomyces sp. 7N604]|uniref:ATP-binding protein n=1 Tax=Streptomyces sp. 7N604 TaxID=3457415 RepID=UPI003FD606AD